MPATFARYLLGKVSRALRLVPWAMAAALAYPAGASAAPISSGVTINFNSSGFNEGVYHGSNVFGQGDVSIKYSAGQWIQATKGAYAGVFRPCSRASSQGENGCLGVRQA